MVDHGDGHISARHCAVGGSRHASSRGISTYASCATSRLMHRGIGARELDIGVGGGGVVGEGVGAGAGTDVGV